MLNLILVLISIALTASVLYSTLSYLPALRPLTDRTYELSKSGFTSLESAYVSYKAATTTDLAPSTWMADLTPKYVFIPRTPEGMTWSYNIQSGVISPAVPGNYFCLSGIISKAQWDGLNRLNKIFSSQQYFQNTTCGSTTNISEPTSWPASVAMTYWVTPPN